MKGVICFALALVGASESNEGSEAAAMLQLSIGGRQSDPVMKELTKHYVDLQDVSSDVVQGIIDGTIAITDEQWAALGGLIDMQHIQSRCTVPTTVPTTVAVPAGNYYASEYGGCGMDDSDTVYCWGTDDMPEIRDAEDWLPPLKFVTGGSHDICGIAMDDTVSCAGRHASSVASAVQNLGTVQQLAMASTSSIAPNGLALKENGQVQSFGSHANNNIGGCNGDMAKAVFADNHYGGTQAAIIKEDDKIKLCRNENNYNNFDHLVIGPGVSGGTWSDIEVSTLWLGKEVYLCVVAKADGAVSCWTKDSNPGLSWGAGTAPAETIYAKGLFGSYDQVCAIQLDDTLRCWSFNNQVHYWGFIVDAENREQTVHTGMMTAGTGEKLRDFCYTKKADDDTDGQIICRRAQHNWVGDRNGVEGWPTELPTSSEEWSGV